MWELAKAKSELTHEQQESFFHVLANYADIFAISSAKLRYANKVRHEMNTGGAIPIRQAVKRLPPHRREELHKSLDMLRRGIIEKSRSP